MDDIEEIEHSIELPIGSRFYFRNHLYEVIESNSYECCQKCAFDNELYDFICQVMNCGGKYYSRLDKKSVIFKEIKETEEEKNND